MPPMHALRERTPAKLRPGKDGYANDIADQMGNTGLLLDRYLAERKPENGGDHTARTQLLTLAAALGAPAGYDAALRRWEASLQAMGAVTMRMRVSGRMIVGLGGESALESAVTLQRLWGVPYIPGSAVKGLTAHYVAQALARQANPATADPDLVPLPPLPPDTPRNARRRTPNTYGVLFGAADDAAYLTWFDAWFMPDRGKPDDPPIPPLRRDVITVHHQRYYSTRGEEKTNPGEDKNTEVPPWDFDDPNPVPFLSATGDYLFAVKCANPAWHDVALGILRRALGEWGIGGKTNAGYGRLYPIPASPASSDDAGGKATPTAAEHQLVGEVRAIPTGKVAGMLEAKYHRWTALTDRNDKRAVAEAIRARLVEAKLLERKGDKKPSAWAVDIVAYLLSDAPEGGAG